MRRLVLSSLILGSVALALAGPAQADPHNVFGTWLTQAGTSKVEIRDCGDATPCGVVTWLDAGALNPGDTPQTLTDRNNPDASLRERPILGMTMMEAFQRKAKDWRGGRIYDPESGKVYGARLKRLADGRLQMKGCIGPVCQTQVWTPAT